MQSGGPIQIAVRVTGKPEVTDLRGADVCPERDCEREPDKSNKCQDLTNTQKITEACRSRGLSFDVTVDAGFTRR